MAKPNLLTENFPDDDPNIVDVTDDGVNDPALDDDTPDDPMLAVNSPSEAPAVAAQALAELLRADTAKGTQVLLAMLSAGGARVAPPPTQATGRAGYMDRNGEPLDWETAPPGTVGFPVALNRFPDMMTSPEKKYWNREAQEKTADGYTDLANRDPLLTPVTVNGVRWDLPPGKRVRVPNIVADVYNNAVDEQIAFQNCETPYMTAHADILRNNGKGGRLRLAAHGAFDNLEVYHTVRSAGGYVPPEIERQLRRRPATEVPDTNARPGALGVGS